MVRAASLIFFFAIALAASTVAHAASALTQSDLTWLSDNLNLSADSPVLQTLSDAQQTRLHALIGAAKTGADRKRQEVVNFITRTIGDSFEDTLQQAGQPAAQPTELGANRTR